MWPCTPCTVRRPLERAAPADLDRCRRRCARSRARPRCTSRCARRARAAVSTTRRVPSTDGPSSSLVIRKAMRSRDGCGCVGDELLGRGQHRREPALHVGRPAAVEHAVADRGPEGVASATPRADPVGTTSVCPAKHNTGAAAPRRAQKFCTLPKGSHSTSKPMSARRLRQQFLAALIGRGSPRRD